MQKLTTTIITLGLAIVIIFGVLWPAYQMLNGFKNETVKISDAISQKNQEIKSLEFFSQKMKEIDPAQVNRLNALAPPQSQPDLITEVSNLALSSGLTINTFNNIATENQAGGFLKQSNVELSFKSDYANLKKFLENVGLSARLFELTALSLKASTTELNKSLLPLDVKANFNIYYK